MMSVVHSVVDFPKGEPHSLHNPLTDVMDQEVGHSPVGGAPGPPKNSINALLTEHHLDHAHELRALAILAMVVFSFLALVAILYALRWICLVSSNKVDSDSSELAEPEESSVRLEGAPVDEEKVISHSDQVSDSESAKRCYPSRDKMLQLHLPKKKRVSEKEEGLSEQTLKAVPDYSKIVLKQDQLYVGGLSKHPRVPPSYISTLETPGTRKVIWATQSISGTSVLRTARPPSRKSSIDRMKISEAPILSAPKKTTSSPSSSVMTAKEAMRVAAPGQAQAAPQPPVPQVVSTQPRFVAVPPQPAAAQAVPTQLIQPAPTSPGVVPTPGPQEAVAQSKPFTSSTMMISGQASVKTASRTENLRAANAVKITAAPVSITAMRRKPLPKAFTEQARQPATQPAAIATARSSLADAPVTTPPRTARAVTPRSGQSISMTSKSSKSTSEPRMIKATTPRGSRK